jgi:hypothetical protein
VGPTAAALLALAAALALTKAAVRKPFPLADDGATSYDSNKAIIAVDPRMGQILVRNLDDAVIAALKERGVGRAGAPARQGQAFGYG